MNKKDTGDIYTQQMDWYDNAGVPQGYAAITDDYYETNIKPKVCECGCEAAGVGGHSVWCPKFEGLIANE